MKMRSKTGSFLAALALGATILAGSVLPSQAQTTSVQTVQSSTSAYGGWYGPTMFWPVTSSTPGTVTVTPQASISQPTDFWGGWGGWGCWW